MQHARGGDAELGGARSGVAQKAKVLDGDPFARPFQARIHTEYGRREIHLFALAAKLHRVLRSRDGHTAQAFQKVDVEDGAPKLTVGDALQADAFLQLDHVADATIFQRSQRFGGDFALLALAARQQEFFRAEQTANVVGSEGRSRSLHERDCPPGGVLEGSPCPHRALRSVV
jgi:hypothetical protein